MEGFYAHGSAFLSKVRVSSARDKISSPVYNSKTVGYAEVISQADGKIFEYLTEKGSSGYLEVDFSLFSPNSW